MKLSTFLLTLLAVCTLPKFTYSQTNGFKIKSDTIILNYKTDTSFSKFTINPNSEYLPLVSPNYGNNCWIVKLPGAKYSQLNLADYTLHEPQIKNLPTALKNFTPTDNIITPDPYQQIWNGRYYIVITDREFNYIRHYKNPYYKYYKKFAADGHGQLSTQTQFLIDSVIYFSISPYPKFQEKYFKKKQNKHENLAYLKINVSEYLDRKNKKIKPAGYITSGPCDTYRKLPAYTKVQYADTVNKKIWFTDVISKNLICHSILNQTNTCYPLPAQPIKYLDEYYAQWDSATKDLFVNHEIIHKNDTMVSAVIGMINIRHFAETNNIVRVMTLSTQDSVLAKKLQGISNTSGTSVFQSRKDKFYLFEIYQNISLGENPTVNWQIIVPYTDKIHVVNLEENEIRGIATLYQSDLNLPGLITWKIEKSE